MTDNLKIDPESKPCNCYGSPILSVYKSPTDFTQTGYRCAKCGAKWPVWHAPKDPL